MIETQYRQRATQLRAEYERRVADIAADGRLTEQHRAARLARELPTLRQQLPPLREFHNGVVAAQRRESERSAFGVADADVAGLRAAVDSVTASCSTPTEAMNALRRAERRGDSLQAHALFLLGEDQGGAASWTPTSISTRAGPGRSTLLQEHSAAADDPSERLFSPFHPPAKPASLAHILDAHLEQVAAEVPADEPPPAFTLPGRFA